MRYATCLALASIVASPTVIPATATLYAVSGDGGNPAESLYTVDTTNAALTFVQTLGNGDDGEIITYHPPSGLIYHWSGRSSTMETVNPISHVVTPVVSGGPEEILAAVWDAAAGHFLVESNDALYSVTTSGVYTFIGEIPNVSGIDLADIRGLAFVGSTLYAIEHIDSFDDDGELDLLTFDKTTAAVLSHVNITLSGFALNGSSFGLVADGSIGKLYAGVGVGSTRRLVTIDPTTAVATDIGLFSNKISSLATDAVPITTAIPESRWGMFALAILVEFTAIAKCFRYAHRRAC